MFLDHGLLEALDKDFGTPEPDLADFNLGLLQQCPRMPSSRAMGWYKVESRVGIGIQSSFELQSIL